MAERIIAHLMEKILVTFFLKRIGA